MRIENNQMVFDLGEKVICINKGKEFAIGSTKPLVLKGVPSLVIRVDQKYNRLSSIDWDYIIPWDEHLQEHLEEFEPEQQFIMIKETHESILANHGRRIRSA